MAPYQHILLAVDFFEQDQLVIKKAQHLATLFQAKLSLIHVVDSIPITETSYGGEMPFQFDLTDELMGIARTKLMALAQQLAIAEERTYLEMGSAQLEIIRVSEEQHVDLIVVGSHGRHGLALLLGSTANSVLHHAKCDVLAVRLPND